MESSGIFWNFLVNDDYNIKVLATKLSPLLLLHCYNQVAKIVTLIFRLFCLLQKCFCSIETKKLLVRIAVFNLQSLTLLATRRDAVVEHCIVLNVPILQHYPMMIYIITLRNNTVQQDLQKHTSVLCFTQNFLAFMLYVNTKTLNMENKLGLERAVLMWRT